jgi:hypothetical protein
MRTACEGVVKQLDQHMVEKSICLIDGNKVPENMPLLSKAIIRVGSEVN